MKIRKIMALYSVLLMVNSQINYGVVFGDEIQSDNNYEILCVDTSFEPYQMDKEELAETSTKELLYEVIECPLNYKYMIYGEIEMGLEENAKKYNVLEELLSRNDLIDTVYEDYLTTSIPEKTFAEYTVNYVNDRGGYKIDVNDVKLAKKDYNIYIKNCIEEHLLATEKAYQELEPFNRLKVLKKVEQLEKEKGCSELYANQEQSIFAFEALSNEDSSWYDVTDYYFNESEENIQDSLGGNIIMNSSVTVYLYTPNNTTVWCTQTIPNPINSDAVAYNSYYGITDAVLYSNGRAYNNCHAFAWALNQDVWMNYTESGKYVSDGSYISTTSRVNWYKVAYSSYHSGLIVDASHGSGNNGPDPIIRSKIGGGAIIECPSSSLVTEYGSSATYYKRAGIC